jgi:RecB family exonuclease
VLGLERWDEPERVWSADPGEIGSAVHDILEKFYKQATLPLQTKLRERYRRELRDIALARLAEFEKTNVTGLPVVWSLRRAALLRDLLRFLDFEIARADDLIPREFEKNFGPVRLPGSLMLRGRIDRIDVGGGAARILDYKTGKAWHKKDDSLDGGEALQLPLYAMAAKQALGLPVVSSEYAYLTSRGGYRYVRFTREGLEQRAGDLAQVLETLAAMLRAGEFPQYAEHGVCAWCDYRLICGNAIEVLADRKRDDPRLAPFHAVKEIE